MSGHDAHDAAPAEAHAAHPAPGLPEVHDEAGDTPLWVPIVGATLLVLGGMWVIVKIASYSSDAAAVVATDGAVSDGQAGDGGTPAAEAPTPQ